MAPRACLPRTPTLAALPLPLAADSHLNPSLGGEGTSLPLRFPLLDSTESYDDPHPPELSGFPSRNPVHSIDLSEGFRGGSSPGS